MRNIQLPIEILHFAITTAILLMTVLLLLPTSAYSYKIRGIDVKPHGTITETYDDNVSYVKDNKKSDFVTSLKLGLGAKYEGKTRSLELTGNVTQHIFADNKDFNNTSQHLILNFQNEFSKYDRVSVKNVFTHAEEPQSFEDNFGRTTGRFSYFLNNFNLDYTKDLTKQLNFTVKYANVMYLVSSEGRPDSYLNRIGFEAGYALSSATSFLFSYDFENRKFDPGKDASTHTIAPGLRRYITKKLYFDGKAGIDFIDSFDDKAHIKPLIFASITDEIDENTRASLSFTKRYSTTSYVEGLFNSWRISGAFTRQLLERLKGSLSCFYGEGEFASLDFTQNLQGASVAFTYDIRENLKGNTYFNEDSNIEDSGYTNNTVFLGLTANFLKLETLIDADKIIVSIQKKAGLKC
jgi:hypothetical protein